MKKQVLGLIPKPGVPVKSSRSASLYDEDVVVLDDGEDSAHVDWSEHDRILGKLDAHTSTRSYDSLLLPGDSRSNSSRLKRGSGGDLRASTLSDFFASQLFVSESEIRDRVSSQSAEPTASWLPLLVLLFCLLSGASHVVVYPLSLIYVDLTSLTTTFVLISLSALTLTSWLTLWAFSKESLESRKEGMLFACLLLCIGNLLFAIPLARHLSVGSDGIYGVIDPVDIQLDNSPSWSQVCMILACMCFGIASVASTVVPTAMCHALNLAGFAHSKALAACMVAASVLGEGFGIGFLAFVAAGQDRVGLDFGLDVNSVVLGMHVNVMNVACVVLSAVSLGFLLLACTTSEKLKSISSANFNLRNADDWYYYDTTTTRKQQIWMVSVLLQCVLRFTHTLCFFALMFALKRDLMVSWNTLLLAVLIAVVSTSLPAMVMAVKVSALIGAHRTLRFALVLAMLCSVSAHLLQLEFAEFYVEYKLQLVVMFVSILWRVEQDGGVFLGSLFVPPGGLDRRSTG